MPVRLPLAVAAAVAALASLPAPAGAAEALHGVTADNRLVTFASDSPGAIRSSVPITGLQEGERLVGIDLRPRTGQLYGLGSSSRVYVVNPVSGAATAVGPPFSPLLAGQSFGVDFNPAVDRIRVVSDGRQNLRLNPEDGQVAGDDQPLQYAGGDPGNGSTPAVGAAAYTRPADAAQTQLFVIDSARDVLARQDPPNAGTLTTIGPLGADLGGPAGFDVAADGRAWIVGRPAGAPPQLYLVDLGKGNLSPGARRPVVGADVTGITAAGPVPDDSARPSLLVAVDRIQKRSARRLKVQVSCSEACTLGAGVQVRGRSVGAAEGALGGPGRVTLTLRLRLPKGAGALKGALRVTAKDAASNNSVVRRSLRFG